jgi:hypothetical protein
MKKQLTIQEHLKKARTKAHITQSKNGQYKKMAKIRWAKKK